MEKQDKESYYLFFSSLTLEARKLCVLSIKNPYFKREALETCLCRFDYKSSLFLVVFVWNLLELKIGFVPPYN